MCFFEILFLDFGKFLTDYIIIFENLESCTDGVESLDSEERVTKCPSKNVSVPIRQLAPAIIVQGSKLLYPEM